MGIEFGKVLKAAREQKRYTQAALAALLNVSRSAVTQWENGTTTPSTSNLITISRLLGYDFVNGLPDFEDPVKGVPPSKLMQQYSSMNPEERPEVVPVLATRVVFYEDENSGDDLSADIILEERAINYVYRPSPLNQAKGVFCFHMATSVLEPRFFLGELVYASRNLIPSRLDYVVVRSRSKDMALVGRLLNSEAGGAVLQRHNPDEEVEIDRRNVERIERIYPWEELLRGRGR